MTKPAPPAALTANPAGTRRAPALAERLYRMMRPGSSPTAALPDLPPFAGPVLWLHAGDQAALNKLSVLSEAVLHRAQDCRVLLTHMPGLEQPTGCARRTIRPLDPDFAAGCRHVLETARPAVLLILGPELPPTLISMAGQAGARIMVAGLDSPDLPGAWGRMPGLRAGLLQHLDRVFLSEINQGRAWRRAGMASDRLVISGALDDTPPALACNETEREALAQAFRQRTVWLAVDIPEGEEGQVIAAHREALRESLRVVLILNPASARRGPDLKQALAPRFNTALRSDDELITPETQIYIADTDGERGLWYRLAVACHVGGSLSTEGARVNPLEGAALGCVIVHGPNHARHGNAFERLAKAKASMPMRRPDELGRVICACLSPETAACMAHQGWQVISAGAEASDTICDALVQALSSAGQTAGTPPQAEGIS